MKDFCKWLGVDEKIAKIVVWLLIFMAFLIMFNSMLESVGFPYYRLTVENLSRINIPKMLEYAISWLIAGLNFLSIVLITFRVKEIKKILKYLLLYLVLIFIINSLGGYIYSQIFMIIYFLIFAYIFSGKNWRYLFYIAGAYLLDTTIQYLTYLYKIKFINFETITSFNRLLVSLDYFLIMFVIIFIKEIILNKRGDRK